MKIHIYSIDSQLVKAAQIIWEHREIDANKKVNYRKRQLLVESGGRLWFARVHAGNLPDRAAALAFMPEVICQDEHLVKIMVTKRMLEFLQKKLKNMISNLKKLLSESTKCFVPVAKRWVVERTIAWSNFFRRIVKDYEYTPSSSIAWMYLANIQIMLQPIHPLNKTLFPNAL